MTDKERELHEKLQPVYEKMGPWQGGDKGITLYRGEETPFLVYVAYDGGLLAGTICTITDNFGKVNFQDSDAGLLRIPATIDSDGPDGRPSERCLWGMVDWGKFSMVPHVDGNLWVFERGKDGLFDYQDCPPTLALLKALCHQHGIEVAP